MTCDEALELIEAYHDGELVPETRSSVKEHIAGCATCRKRLDELGELSGLVRRSGAESPPEGMDARIRAKVAEAAAARRAARSEHPRRLRLYAALAACQALLIAGAGAAGYLMAERQDTLHLALVEAVDAHVRRLADSRPFDVASSDSHTVKPWFAGRIDFSPAVNDLGAHGFPLVGGRTDYVAGHRTAVLVYGRREHKISVFVERPGGLPPPAGTVNGYNVVSWRLGDLNYTAVSDVNPQELGEFKSEFMAAAAAPGSEN